MMSDYTLALEGSTYGGSVTLLNGADVVAERTLPDNGIPSKEGRPERVLPSVAECLEEAGVLVGEIARVVCGAGPGSFTSLRISASVAKGIAVGVGCPMYSVSSLVLSAAGVQDHLPEGLYMSLLPAMRGEWFGQLVRVRADARIGPQGDASIISGAALISFADELGASRLGPGQPIEARPHARSVSRLIDAILTSEPVPTETWEPNYGRLAEAQVKWEAAHGRPLRTAT